MTTHKAATTLAVAAAAIGSGFAAATPAAAGGIIVIASPSFDNSCANQGTRTQPHGHTSKESGSAQGMSAQIPLASPLNHCGGADVPLINEGFQMADICDGSEAFLGNTQQLPLVAPSRNLPGVSTKYMCNYVRYLSGN
ncbi:hypothetical protein [Streptomyces noursei]|uniref:hypothetical protein n=1 Tax=Streptomyces noursei TaxID=1971 RepID=UPI0023B86837|nr:hypothetical protein [Streptomyces noursei]